MRADQRDELRGGRREAAAALASQRMIDFLLEFTKGSKQGVGFPAKRKRAGRIVRDSMSAS